MIEPLMFEIGKEFDIAALQANFLQKDNEISADIDARTDALAGELTTPLDKMTRALNGLAFEKSMQIRFDLLDGTAKLRAKDHPLAAASDLLCARDQHENLRLICSEISRILMHHIGQVHPEAQHARMQINVAVTALRRPTDITLHAQIDGLQRKLKITGIADLVLDAARLSLVTCPGQDQQYVISAPVQQDTVSINSSETLVFIRATSPEHAWLLYADHDNPHQVINANAILHEILPVKRALWIAADQEVSERIATIYHPG